MLEGVQSASETEVFNLPVNDCVVDEPVTTSGPELPEKVGDVVVPVSEAPEEILEAVVEEKVEIEPEDPILPDHFYDDGSIPVFKPVCPNKDSFCVS
jgi:hypothetical protein